MVQEGAGMGVDDDLIALAADVEPVQVRIGLLAWHSAARKVVKS